MDANSFTDIVLQLTDELFVAEHLDPYEFVDIDFLGVHYDSWIGGFSSLARSGDASLVVAESAVNVTAPLKMTNITGNFTLEFTILGFEIKGGATAKVDYVDMKLALSFLTDKTNRKTNPKVDDFQIIQIGRIHVKVFGLGPFNFLANMVADFIVNLIKYLVPLLLNGVIGYVIQIVLDAIFKL